MRAAAAGVRLRTWVAPFDQHQQLLLDPESELHRLDPELVFLAVDPAGLTPDLRFGFAHLDDAARAERFEDLLDATVGWAARAGSTLGGVVLVAGLPRPISPGAGIADGKAGGETELYLRLRLEMESRVRDLPRAHVLDLERHLLSVGSRAGTDLRMELMARMPWSEPLVRAVSDDLVRAAVALCGRTAKCLALDFDGTLWGGIVGEEGTDGVRIGPGDPAGEAYWRFQQRLKAMTARGLILAGCSKNNPEDALSVFRDRREMVLREDDFAAMEIGWEPKYVGLRRLAETLDLGLDSFVFIDDNPMEIEVVRQALPEVRCMLLPPDPSAYVEALDARVDLDRLAILEEDRAKTRQYRQQGERRRARSDLEDLGTYLASLETRVRIRAAREADVPRLHQLFTKTNQFNVTTIRYELSDVERFVADDACRLDVVSVEDRFGDLGIVGLVLRREDHIDSFILSCRALGRRVETAVMNHVKRTDLLEAQRDELTASFRPTERNSLCGRFFDEQGFEVVAERDGGRDYRLAAGRATEIACDWISIAGE